MQPILTASSVVSASHRRYLAFDPTEARVPGWCHEPAPRRSAVASIWACVVGFSLPWWSWSWAHGGRCRGGRCRGGRCRGGRCRGGARRARRRCGRHRHGGRRRRRNRGCRIQHRPCRRGGGPGRRGDHWLGEHRGRAQHGAPRDRCEHRGSRQRGPGRRAALRPLGLGHAGRGRRRRWWCAGRSRGRCRRGGRALGVPRRNRERRPRRVVWRKGREHQRCNDRHDHGAGDPGRVRHGSESSPRFLSSG